ncbi:hypothetical protein [Methylobacterium sp. NEAU K]|uniref:hypothetical protein n=1 Tax=Methylobacterium sp. NEAU K TaxID=3064946 RepID=UPI002734A00D|nr:hypothetical protein [Methylobacterium sp. NEAU K]MDP4002711.1 hypothetical protein [Methylobacterium sp. NEAU K]
MYEPRGPGRLLVPGSECNGRTVDGQEQPQDPQFNGSVSKTRQAHNDDLLDLYGQAVNGTGPREQAPPSGTGPR